MVLITIVTGAYKPTNITGGPHIVETTIDIHLSGISQLAEPMFDDQSASVIHSPTDFF